MNNKKEKKISVIYNFFPVQENDVGKIESCNTWHWTLFGWWFEVYSYLCSILANLVGIENLQFEEFLQ